MIETALVKNLRLVVLDIDGTTIDAHPNRAVSGRLTRAVDALRLHGVHVCPATGRSLSSLVEEPSLGTLSLGDLAVVSAGGAIADLTNRTILWYEPISTSSIARIYAILEPLRYECYFYNDYSEDLFLSGGVHLPDPNISPLYFLGAARVIPAHIPIITAGLDEIDDINYVITRGLHRPFHELHVTHKNATKHHATTRMQELLGASHSTSVGVGDGHNDLDLFRAVGLKVAMDNAVAELKDAADLVIGHVGSDSLARFLEDLLAQYVRAV